MKRATNVALETTLLDDAKAFGINLSKTLEEALIVKLRNERARRWLEDNRAAIESYNREVEEHGTFAERMGLWKE